MLLWFVGGSALIVWGVFQSRGVDYRTVALGSLLPMLDIVTGGTWLAHTLLAAVVALGAVMLTTQGRRLVRRRWLGVPIGWFLHLVLDATWSSAERFWWPVFGTDLGGAELLVVSRPGLAIVLELLGVAALWFLYRQGRLDLADRREAFLQKGTIAGPVNES